MSNLEKLNKERDEAAYHLIGVDRFGHDTLIAWGDLNDMQDIKAACDEQCKPEIKSNNS